MACPSDHNGSEMPYTSVSNADEDSIPERDQNKPPQCHAQAAAGMHIEYAHHVLADMHSHADDLTQEATDARL